MVQKLKDQGKMCFERNSHVVRSMVLKLLREDPISHSQWQDLFWLVDSLCFDGRVCAFKVLGTFKEDVLTFVKGNGKLILVHQDDNALLKAYVAKWEKFYAISEYLPLPFRKLDRCLNLNTTECGVRNFMFHTWDQNIFSKIEHRLLNSAVMLIHADRLGKAINVNVNHVKGIIQSCVNLNSFGGKLNNYLEKCIKVHNMVIHEFYYAKASQYLGTNGVYKYMEYADQKLKEEEQRASKYVGSFSGLTQAFTKSSLEVFVIAFMEVLLAECLFMIENMEIQKLQLLFKLMYSVPSGIDSMLIDLEQHIIIQGLADMTASANITQDSEKYVEQLLELFTRNSKIIKESFNDDPRFLTSRDKAFMKVVNDTSIFRLELPSRRKEIATLPESRCPELLANYCDMLLRKTPLSRKLTSDQIDGKLKDVVLLLKYVQNKDVFIRYYTSHLIRRILLDISADYEKDEFMIGWLRDVGMPAHYINKLITMFNDIKVSKVLNEDFKAVYKNDKGNLAESISAKILNAGALNRGGERVQVSLPIELEEFIPKFEKFYNSKHKGRKLQWYHNMSSGTIAFCNNAGKFNLEVTTFQMAVLFAWSHRNSDKISFENLRLATQLPDAELRITMWSLVASQKLKRQLLLYEPDAKSHKDFDNSTLFWVNQNFAVIKNGKPLKRGKVNLIGRLQLSTPKSNDSDNESIVQLRILRTQEALVKIMKMRQRSTSAQLQTELIKILKNMFLPSRNMIEEQIQWLIEHEYMKRDEENTELFIYMA